MPIVVDAHSDLPNDLHPRRLAGERQVLENHWIPRMRKGNIDVRVIALYSEPQFLPELALRRALDQVATVYEEIDESPSSRLCRTHQDILKAKEDNKVAFLLCMEGSEPLGADLQLLRIFHALGVRILGLTHALRTYLADGAFFTPRRTGEVGGLTDVGIGFVEKAQSLGMLVDVSHMNDPGFWDVIKFSKAPVIASHSNCRALKDHPRNLTDEQIKAVAGTGGVIGINACRSFVENQDFEDLLNHVNHLVKMGGIEHVGIGVDFVDYLADHLTEFEKARLPEGALMPVDGLAGDEDIPVIAEGLAKKGYSGHEVDLIMGENFMRVFKEVLK